MTYWVVNGKQQSMKEKKNIKESTQVLTFRMPKSKYEVFEKTCLEQRHPMSKIMKEAVNEYLNKQLTLNN
jgi:predicted GNAT superfamily acetyltransferase